MDNSDLNEVNKQQINHAGARYTLRLILKLQTYGYLKSYSHSMR